MTDLLTGRSAPKGVALASRKSAIAYNISDVIEKVKDIFPDTFSEDVYNHFGTSRKVGNLLVVYHGTDADFTVFDHTKARANMDIQGSFFSPWEIDAGGYGSKVGGLRPL